MADKFGKDKRSSIMAKVKGENTTPELVVRKLLFGMGYRYRLHRKDLPGKPDIVMPKYKLVIFVHGCFWHGCPNCKRAQIRPKENSEYWNKKLDRNKERDFQNENNLINLGWQVLIIWECETKKTKKELLVNKLQETLKYGRQTRNPDRTVR